MTKFTGVLYLYAAFLSFSSQFVLGTTLPHNAISAHSPHVLGKRGGLFDVPELRILSLGASIVYGYGSSNGNGFRKTVYDQLLGLGAKPSMVGTERSGSMAENRVSGYPSYLIKDIGDTNKARGGLNFQPNVILFNGGTNNCAAGAKPEDMIKDIEALVTDLFESVPGVTIFMSSLIVSADSNKEACGVAFNTLLRAWTENWETYGFKIHFVDMHGPDGPQQSDLTSDGIHPNDAGHEKMAKQWVKRMLDVDNIFPDEITAAAKIDVIEGSNTCDKTMDMVDGPHQIMAGSQQAYDDGNYKHASEYIGNKLLTGYAVPSEWTDHPENPNDPWFAEGVYWADMDGDGIDDFIWYADDHTMIVKYSLSGGYFQNWYPYALEFHCLRRGVRFCDVDGDGKDDLVCIWPNGDMQVFHNIGGYGNSKWEDLGIIMSNPDPSLVQANVRLGDIDGDGRCDYMLLGNDGNIRAWRNGGQGIAPTSKYGGYWQELGTIFTGKGYGDINGVRFVDINGDGRDDWIWVSDTGAIDTYINKRGHETGLVPFWDFAGTTHIGMGVPGVRNRITLGRFTGGVDGIPPPTDSPPARRSPLMWRADYAYIENSDSVKIYANKGSGGRTRKGDGARFCDVDGDGKDDYLWLGIHGELYLYLNIGKPGSWGYVQVVGTLNIGNPDLGDPRKAVHFVDFDGDGKCDIIVNYDGNTAFEVFKMELKNGQYTITTNPKVYSQPSCKERWGIGFNDLAIRWVDIDGDGSADFLCIEKNGRVTGALNDGYGDFEDVGQIKYSIGADRADLKFVDLNGDGKADLLWVDKFIARVRTWYNNGRKDVSGSSFWWDCRTNMDDIPWQCETHGGGMARGANIEFMNYQGHGRADFVHIDPSNAAGWGYWNECPGCSTSTKRSIPSTPFSSHSLVARADSCIPGPPSDLPPAPEVSPPPFVAPGTAGKASDADVETATREFPGLFWESAQQTCDYTQFNALKSALTDAMYLAGTNYVEDAVENSPGWRKFFLPTSFWQGSLYGRFNQVKGYWSKVNGFVSTGAGTVAADTPKRKRRQNAIHLYCGNPSAYQTCGTAGVAAYTIFPVTQSQTPNDPPTTKLENCPRCTAISFCQPFWDSKILANVLKEQWRESDINAPGLQTREHAFLHEFFHHDKIGFDGIHIGDISGGYGPAGCENLANKNLPNNANSDVAENADSYTWVSSYNAYYATFGWGVGKRSVNGTELEEPESDNQVFVKRSGRMNNLIRTIWKA